VLMQKPEADKIAWKAVRQKAAALLNVVGKSSSILIATHNYPDPDAIASAACLQFTFGLKTKAKAEIVFGGVVGRAENRAMLKELDLKIFSSSVIDYTRYDCRVLVDTQPSTGYASLPPEYPPDAVIDHHPLQTAFDLSTLKFVDIVPGYGATTTIVSQYMRALRIEPPSNLATAMVYGIKSDTRELGSEAGPYDREAFSYLVQRADLYLLSRIEQASWPWSHFRIVAAATGSAYLYNDSVLVSDLGEIDTPEIVAEVAEYFLRLEGVKWILCLGYCKRAEQLVLSVRTWPGQLHAGRKLAEAVGSHGRAGGHRTMAGGYITGSDMSAEELERLKGRFAESFVSSLGVDATRRQRLGAEEIRIGTDPGREGGSSQLSQG